MFNKERDAEGNKKRRLYYVYGLLSLFAITGMSVLVSGGIDGSGTANYLSRWTNATYITTGGIYDNGSYLNTSYQLYELGSRVCTVANGLCAGSGTVTSVNVNTTSTAPINVTGTPVTTSGTILIQIPDATVFQSGLATATQITALAGKVPASDCTGDNGTHVNVTMNLTTAGAQCVTVLKSVTPYVSNTWTNYTDTLVQTNNNTVYSTLTNLTAKLAANSIYTLACNFITFSAAATTGEQLQVNITGTAPTRVRLVFNSQQSATTRTSFNSTSVTSNNFADTGSNGINLDDISLLTGYVATGSGTATITYNVKSEITSSNIGYAPGSFCTYNKVA